MLSEIENDNKSKENVLNLLGDLLNNNEFEIQKNVRVDLDKDVHRVQRDKNIEAAAQQVKGFEEILLDNKEKKSTGPDFRSGKEFKRRLGIRTDGEIDKQLQKVEKDLYENPNASIRQIIRKVDRAMKTLQESFIDHASKVHLSELEKRKDTE